MAVIKRRCEQHYDKDPNASGCFDMVYILVILTVC